MHALTGSAAIERYLQAEEKGRLIQSLKSHLSSRSLTGTEIFGRRYKLEELISRILSDLREQGGRQFEKPICYAMVGRPVRFVGAETPEDDEFAVARLKDAFACAGFERVEFEMEPVAAAYSYEATLDHDELILIGDFGGGTSDFSLLRVGPGVCSRGRTTVGIYGVISFSVTRRTREIGVRIALGATPAGLRRLILGELVKLALFGLAAGIPAALALAHFMSGLLFAITPADPLTFTGVALLLTMVALAAGFIPARRAMRVDPMTALRCE